ncbi:MAG: hypothetical protein IKO26_02635 [Paludibacteraceae bacterium]|nr:hypothetical protein [Paludibacteraceae bacterium]
MKKHFLLGAFISVVLLTMPGFVHSAFAEGVEIQLTEVIDMGTIPGDNPLDDPGHMGSTPTRPYNFRATINGNSLSVSKQETSIPSAQAIVVNASTGNVVLNQQFTSTLAHQITNSGIYVLRIQTANGALVGQFVVQ